MIGSGKALVGDSFADTTIVSNATNLPVITIPGGTDFFEIRDLRLTHAGVTAGPGADGISQVANTTTDRGLLDNLYIDQNFNGMSLWQTGRTVIQNVVCDKNNGHGFFMISAGTNAVQWQLEGCAANLNGLNGFLWYSTGTNAGGTSTSTMSNCTSFANGANGVLAQGTAQNPLQAIRIFGGFFGADAGHCICLDTYGGGHIIQPLYIEAAGDCGIYISPNNNESHVAAGLVTGSGRDGLLTAASITNVVGGIYQANGGLMQSGRRNGIYVFQGSATINGVRSRDNGALYQDYGVIANTDTLIVGCDLRNNLAAGITGTPAPQSTGNRV